MVKGNKFNTINKYKENPCDKKKTAKQKTPK